MHTVRTCIRPDMLDIRNGWSEFHFITLRHLYNGVDSSGLAALVVPDIVGVLQVVLLLMLD